MSTCFISHATRDAAFAQFVTQRLRSAGVQTFLAPMGIEPGARWSDAIRKELDSSSVVFFLASEEACKSPSVLMEIGGAWLRGKTIIPITWDMGPSGLPSWISETQAIDLRGKAATDILPILDHFAKRLERQQLINSLVLVGLVTLLVACSRT